MCARVWVFHWHFHFIFLGQCERGHKFTHKKWQNAYFIQKRKFSREFSSLLREKRLCCPLQWSFSFTIIEIPKFNNCSMVSLAICLMDFIQSEWHNRLQLSPFPFRVLKWRELGWPVNNDLLCKSLHKIALFCSTTSNCVYCNAELTMKPIREPIIHTNKYQKGS